MGNCPFCGSEIESGDKFCLNCGQSLEQVIMPQSYNPPPVINNATQPESNNSLDNIAAGFKNFTESALQSAKKLTETAKAQYQSNFSGTENNSYSNPVKTNPGFCGNCGEKLFPTNKFCPGCGIPLNSQPRDTMPPIPPQTSSYNDSPRTQEYAGNVLKCPNCGESITQTTAVCPTCGYHITGAEAVSSVQRFNNQLMALESKRKGHLSFLSVYAPADPVDKQKLALIKNFPIPNTIDDITEFMMLAIANIDVNLSKKTLLNNSSGLQILAMEMPKIISDAWVAKMEQAYQKAKIMFPNDPAFSGIRELYVNKMNELKRKVLD